MPYYAVVQFRTLRVIYEGMSLDEAAEAMERGTCLGRHPSRPDEALRRAETAAYHARDGKPVVRPEIPCLRCGRPFRSAGNFNRMCHDCETINGRFYLREEDVQKQRGRKFRHGTEISSEI